MPNPKFPKRHGCYFSSHFVGIDWLERGRLDVSYLCMVELVKRVGRTPQKMGSS